MALQPLWVTLAGGLRVPYVEQGDPSGSAVLFLHAYVDSWRSFERVLPHLPPSLHALAFTQRGHGEADKPDGGYDLEQLSDDVAAFMDAVGLRQAVLVGSSSGGYVAQRFVLDFPARARGLVLVGAPRTLRETPAILDEVAGLEDPVDPAFVREFVGSTTSGAPDEFLETMIAESCRVPAHVWKAALEGLVEAVPPTETGAIDAPALVIWGAQDAYLPRSEQERLVGSITGARLLVYEDAGHIVHWEQPERVARDIARFVSSLAA